MNNFIKFLVFVMVFTMSLGVMAPMPSEAAGVQMLIGVNASPTTGLGYPHLDQAEAEWDGTATDVYILYQSSAEYATGDTISIVASTPLTIATNCGAGVTTDADSDGLADGSGVVVGDTFTWTFTQSTTLGSTASIEFCLLVGALATPGNYSFSMYDSKTGGSNDFGAALLYGLDDNDVLITAEIRTQLEFAIRNVTDTANTNACALGVLSTASNSSCEYRLKVRTNASDGYYISWKSDGALNSGTADIDAIIEDSGAVGPAGTIEEYGVQFAPGTITSGMGCTAIGDYTDNDSPVAGTTATGLVSCAGPNQPVAATFNTAYMAHKASIDSSTGSGFYDQIVTYYVTGNF